MAGRLPSHSESMLSVDSPDDGSEQPPLLSPSEAPTAEYREAESHEIGLPEVGSPEVGTLDQAIDELLKEAVLDRDQVADRPTPIRPDEAQWIELRWIEPAPVRHLPWRSTVFAASAQIPAVVAAATLDVSLVMLSVQVVVVAAMGVLLVLAEWMNLNRSGLAPEEPQPTLDRHLN